MLNITGSLFSHFISIFPSIRGVTSTLSSVMLVKISKSYINQLHSLVVEKDKLNLDHSIIK